MKLSNVTVYKRVDNSSVHLYNAINKQTAFRTVELKCLIDNNSMMEQKFTVVLFDAVMDKIGTSVAEDNSSMVPEGANEIIVFRYSRIKIQYFNPNMETEIQ